ncbi:hypothetical protein QTP88_018679 [Uroleucon formosanum]
MLEFTDEEKLMIFKQCHDSIIGGHVGIHRTIKKIKTQFNWRGLKEDVIEYIKNCESCQKGKVANKNVKQPILITSTSSEPFEKIFLDIVGPLVTTLSGNTYILTLQDDLTKYSMGIALPNHQANTIAEAFVTNFVCTHGIPQTILTDQGTDFLSKIFTEVCKLLQINKINTSPFHPQTNGSLERSHRTLTEYLRHYVDKKLNNWDEYLPYAFFVYNSTEHTSTGYQPYSLLFGRRLEIPIKLSHEPEPRYNYDNYYFDLKQKMQESHKIAKENLIKRKVKSKQIYDNNENSIEIHVKDQILLRDKTQKNKLNPLWIGPYEMALAQINRLSVLYNRMADTVNQTIINLDIVEARTNINEQINILNLLFQQLSFETDTICEIIIAAQGGIMHSSVIAVNELRQQLKDISLIVPKEQSLPFNLNQVSLYELRQYSKSIEEIEQLIQEEKDKQNSKNTTDFHSYLFYVILVITAGVLIIKYRHKANQLRSITRNRRQLILSRELNEVTRINGIKFIIVDFEFTMINRKDLLLVSGSISNSLNKYKPVKLEGKPIVLTTTNKLKMLQNREVKKLYEEYKLEKNGNKCGSYDLFKEVFNKTGYKFKKPKLDTCKTCDTFVLQIKQCKDIQQKILLQQQHETHKKLADLGCMQKKEDKINALASNNIRVLVFDLEQVLDTPALSTNVSFYKRLLSTFNLTIRDCSENEGTECYMWHKAIGGRGSNEIASCLYQKILNLLNNVTHIITYSDTCGGQNRNINMAAMLSLVTANSSTLHIIDQKFLLPGHTHLECDVDHTKIERAKKFSDIPIMIPRDWYQFVRTVKGKKPIKVIEMKQEQFFSFSNLVSTSLTKKTVDTDGNKVNWFHIRLIRYEKVYGKLQFKYSLNVEEPFNLRSYTTS